MTLPLNEILVGDVLERLRELPDECVHAVVTSPPYWGLRDYGVAGQIGLEPTPAEYIDRMVAVFREVRRVLRVDGTAWVNMGDSYAGSCKGSGGVVNSPKQRSNPGSYMGEVLKLDFAIAGLKPKDLVGMPWRLAFALQADGWWLRSDIVWAKPNPMPESVLDRPTRSHEYVFLMARSERYHYDADSVREPYAVTSAERYAYSIQGVAPTARQPQNGDVERRLREAGIREPNPLGRNRRTVWTIAIEPYEGAHFATFPEKLVEPCILAGAPEGGIVLDPFMGSGTTALVALKAGRKFIGIELNPVYADIARKRIEPELAQARLL